jgi:polysaccharide biosynthesis transport protein
MDIYRFIHLLSRKSKYLISIPLVAIVIMFLLTMKQSRLYSTRATIFTAITSNSSLDEQSGDRVDFFATKTAYNNLLSIIGSKVVIEETSLRLLSRDLMLDKPVESEISEKSFADLKKIVPPEIRKLVDKTSEEHTFQNLYAYMKQDKNNFLYGLLNLNHPYFSYKEISKIKTLQIGSSDIIEITYQSDDPGIAYQTLNVLISVFMKEYGLLKKNQTNAVVAYFEAQLQKSSDQLSNVEDRLLIFNKSNNIINYYEQTKHVSSQQEKIEVTLQEVLMEFQASEAVLEKLETETKTRFNINLKNKDIMDIRKGLIEVNQKLAEYEIEQDDSLPVVPRKEGSLEKTRSKLENDLRDKISALYTYSSNSEGVSIETLLNDWLKTVIEYESAKARLLAMQRKSKEFNEQYAKYAPLGATLKRIEREIDIKEKAYLEILHHLGLAKLKQQNEEMMANMKILDKPQLPIDSEPSKRKLYLILIGLFAFIFTLLGLVIFELLDKTIKTSKRFNQLSGLKTIGAYVFEKGKPGVDKNLLKQSGAKPILEMVIQNINTEKLPLIVQFASHWDGEGKTHVVQELKKQLQHIGYSVVAVYFTEEDANKNPYQPGDLYVPLNKALRTASYHLLIKDYESLSTSDIILSEVPSLSNQLFNPSLMSTASLNFLVTDASRTWLAADSFLLENVKAHTNENLFGILNKVQPEDIEDITGEVPKTRSKFRTFIKQRMIKKLI